MTIRHLVVICLFVIFGRLRWNKQILITLSPASWEIPLCVTRPSSSCHPGHIAMFRRVPGMCNTGTVWELLLFTEVPLLFHTLVGVVRDQAVLDCQNYGILCSCLTGCHLSWLLCSEATMFLNSLLFSWSEHPQGARIENRKMYAQGWSFPSSSGGPVKWQKIQWGS